MTDILFLTISLLTIIFAILALESRELVYGAVALALSFLGVAGIFILLDALFVAIFQVLVYVGFRYCWWPFVIHYYGILFSFYRSW